MCICDAGIRRQHVRYLFREVDMVCWKEETGQEKAEKKWKTKRSESGFSGKGISGEITGNQKEVRVKITGKVSVWGRPHLEFETKIGQKIIRPVIFVRKVIAFRT